MKLLIMRVPPSSYFIPFRSKYNQHPVLEHPESILLYASCRVDCHIIISPSAYALQSHIKPEEKLLFRTSWYWRF
jgi:hypothetical protein